MKRLLLTSILLVLSNVAFAEVGPLTAATQKYFAETGQCYIKYRHNSQFNQSHSKMMGGLFGKAIKPNPKYANTVYSLVYEFTKGEEGEANIDIQDEFQTEVIDATNSKSRVIAMNLFSESA